jgi:hypothetical protein
VQFLIIARSKPTRHHEIYLKIVYEIKKVMVPDVVDVSSIGLVEWVEWVEWVELVGLVD